MTIVTEEQLKEIIPGCHDSSLGEGAEQLNGEIQHRDADGNGDNDNEDFVRISLIINGGRKGLDRRRAYWAKARDVLLS